MAEEITGINNEKPNKKQYVVKVPGEQDVAYWDEDKYNSLKDKLFSKYEDAEVTEFSEYDPESSVVSDRDRFTISIPGEEGVAHWDAEKFSRMKDRLLEKYPDARIGVEHDATDDYWAPQAEEARKAKEALDAFESDKERGGFIRKYTNMSDAADEIEREAWNRENDFARFVDSDDNKSKYGSLNEEREALRANYFGNPYVIRQTRTAARKANDLRDDYQRRAKQAQTGAEKNDWKRAAKMQDDIRKILEAPNKYDEDSDYGNGFVQYMQGAGDTFSDKDFYTRGLTSIARNFDLRGISKKLQKVAAEKGGSLTDEDIDNILTNSEKAELESFINLSRVQEERAEAITGAYRAGQGFAESTGYMAEFLLSTGLANVAGKAMSGSSNAIARYLGRQLMSERALARAVEKGVTTVPKMSKAKALTEEAVVKPLVQGLWHTGTQISTLDTISEGLLDTDNSGQLVSVGHAIFDGIIDSVVENWSESVGGALEMGMVAPFRLAGKAGGTIGKTGFGRFARWLYEAKPTQILKEAGFNGMLGEIAEEWAGNAVRVGINKVSGGEMGMTPEQFGDFASFGQQLEMAASFAPMTLIGASSATISALKDRSRYNGLVGNVKDIMRGQGVSEEEIKEVFDTRFDTAEDVGKKFAPYLKAVSDKAQDPAYKESAEKDYRTMLDLAKEIGIGKIVDEMDRLQKDEAKESLRKDIESVAGQFWTEHDSPEARDENGNPVKIQEVKVIRYADGRQKYIVGEEDGTYLTIDQDGRPGFINDEKREEGREDGSILSDKEMLLDDYLREEMEARKIGSEAARMQDERRQMVSEAQKALPVGAEIDRGTPENPKLFVVMAVSPNGVHLERGEGEEFEQEDITWGEAAESLGMQAPMTDAEIEQQETKTYKENESRKDDYNATFIPGTEINVPIESADETPEMVSYQFQRAILDDGQVIFEVMDKETGENTTITEQQAMEGDLAAILASAREKSQEQPEVEETVEEPAEDTLPLFESGPKAGQVNQQKLWQDNPERWAQWNDERRQDNGANTRQYVATAISKLESDISEIQKKHDAELDFDKRENMEGTIGDLQNRLARISAIAKRYDDAERAARDAEVARRNAEMQEQIAKKREEEERKKAQLQQNISSDEQFKAIQKRFAEADKEQGAADELVFGGEQFKGHYYLMEAETPTASHNATEGWAPTAGFPMDETGRSLNTRDYEHEKESQDHVLNTAKDYDSRAIQHMVVVTSDGVVISGNERTMASQIAAKNDTDGKYIDYLSRHAERYGFTPEQVSRFSHPRVVFVPDEAQPYTAKLFDLFNKSEEKRQNVVATAAKVAKITDERLIMRIADLLYDISDINSLYQTPSMVSALMNILIDGKVITREDLPMYLDAEGRLTGAGEDFVESVLFGSIFSQSDDAVRAAMSDKSVRRSIVFAFPTLVRIRNLSGDYSIISEMTEAVSLLAEAKAANNGKAEGAVEDYMNQAQLFSEDLPVHKATVQLLAGVLNDKRYGSLRAVLDQYINRAESADSGQLELLSGDVESKEQILRDILSFNNINIETYDNSGSSENDKVRDSAPEQGVGGTGTDTAGEERPESAPTEGSDTGGEGRGEEQVEEEPAAEEVGESEQPDLFQQEPEETPTQQEEIAAAEAVVDTEPTDAQKEAGNYRKGHVTIDGYDYTIENPKGSVRSGKDASGKEWSQVMNNTYGYIRGTEGVDGDHIDMFISDNPEQGNVYVVDQVRPKVVKSISADNIRRIYADVQAKKYKGIGSQNLRYVLYEAHPDLFGEDRTATEKLIDAAEAERGNALADDILASVEERQDGTEFDEHKVMYGFNSEEEARAAYLSNYEEGWQGMGNITGVSKDEFRKWIESSHRKTKPFAEYVSVKPIEEKESAPSEQPEDGREYGPFTSMVEQARKEMEDEASRKAAEERIAKWKAAIGDVFEVVNSLDEVKEEEARRQIEEADKSIRNGISADDVAVKGWFRPSTGKAYLYLPHIMQTDSPEKNIDKTILHEVISHKGLRNLLGEEKFNSLLDKVWDIMPEDTRSLFLSYVGNGFSSEQERQRAAADECLAHAAEENEDIIKDLDKNFWTKIADFIKGLIEDMVGMDIWNGEKGWLAEELEESYRAFVREARQNAESRLDNAEEGSLFAEGERTKAVDTAKAEASPQTVISNTREKYEDFGEKIGLARKDTAVSGFKKKTSGESLPSWRQKYKVAEVTIIPEDQRTPYGAPFELKPREIGAAEFDYSKPFVAYYIEKKTHRGYTRERYNFIKDTDRNVIIFSSKEQFEATVPVYEAREQGYRVRESGGKFVIIRPASNGKLVEYASFDSKEEAVTYLASPEGCASLLNRKRENYELPALEEITRIGMKDYREGKDITPDDMLETFGFRGGEFGNWVNADERQQFLNVSYDSLMDLSEITGISPKALSLGGELSIAFGARGRQGAKAHYEPTKNVINLTKMNGAGSLAHEWAHAFDNYFGMMDAKSVRNRDKDTEENFKYLSEGSNWKKGARTEIREAFRNVMSVLTRKSVTRQISIDESQERVDRTRRMYERTLKTERDNYARGITRYVYNRKTKQREETKTIPTAEQLAEFDRLVPMLLTDPTFTWEYNFGKDGYRATGEVAEKLYDLVKDVYSNKKGSYGPLHNLFMDSSRLAADIKRLEEAKAGTEETVIVDTDVLKDSKWFDRGMAGEYFSKDIEMFARAFENYISGKLKDSGRSSDYLTYEKGSLYMAIWDHSPYPIGEEREAVEKAFDSLMSSLMEKNEDGKQLLFSRSKKKAPETAVPGDESPFKATVISSADGTKVLNNLEKLAKKCEKLTRGQKRSFLKDIAVALNAEKDGSESKYATFVTKNNITVTIRLSDHNATVSNFDDRGELNGISIVISRKPNSGIIDDGNAHIVEFFYSDKALKKADNSPYSKIVQSLIQSLYSGEYNDMTGLASTTEVNGEQGSGIYESENGILFSKVTDPALLDRLNSEETLKVYRAMQLIDGNLYPPMSAKVGGKKREPTEIGVWEQADENPELADDKGYFKLDKGNKKSLKARYNPYFHTSRSPLNDQFSEAADRPNLVTVEAEIPASELTSGYKAYKAKDAVGEMTWHAGPVSGKLPEGKKRKVILSRWTKVVRILPDSEVADRIAELLSGEEISIPMNTVTPSLREELEKRGVKISEDQRNNRKSDVGSSKGLITPEQDKEYLAAVESGDMEKAKKMVKKAAMKAGYTTKGYHGSIIKGFNEFDDTHKWTEAPDGSYWFAKNKKAADSYRDKDGETREMYLKMDNPLVIDADGMNYDELPNEYEVYFEKEDGSEIDETFGTYEEALRFTTQNGIDENYINPVGVTSVNDYARRAMNAGYDSLVVKNVTDIGMEREDGSSYEEYITDEYAVFSPSQIKSAEPVVRDDEGNVIPLSERFNPENNDIRFSKAEEARFSITDEDGNDIRYTTEGGLPDGNRLSTLVERTYRENGAFSFMGKEKIETAGDVAYIFKELETAAVENSFIVYVKDGIPTILHTGIGDSKQVMIDEASFAAGMNDFAPDEVYMVHNHPSGRVEASRADISELEVLQRMAGTVPVKGVIIDTLSGEYGYYDSETFPSTLIESRNKDNEGTFPLKVMSFDKLVFSPDYAANINKSLVKGPEDVASYLSAHRLGEGRKIGALLVDHGKRVVGNMVLNENEISTDNAGVIARQIVNTSVHCAADGLILFGDFPLNIRSIYTLKSEINSIGGKGISLMDIVRVEGNHTRSLSDGTLDDSGNSDIRFSISEMEDKFGVALSEKGKTWYENLRTNKFGPSMNEILIDATFDLLGIEPFGIGQQVDNEWDELDATLRVIIDKTHYGKEILDRLRENPENRHFISNEEMTTIEKNLKMYPDLLDMFKRAYYRFHTEAPVIYAVADFLLNYQGGRPAMELAYATGIVREKDHPRRISEAVRIALEEYGNNLSVNPRDIRPLLAQNGSSDIRFSMANINERIFISNAEKAVEGIKMEKATPEQWHKMLEKEGGLKAGEDKWIGLSDWLNNSEKKTLTKQEVLDYIRQNEIQIEEVPYYTALRRIESMYSASIAEVLGAPVGEAYYGRWRNAYGAYELAIGGPFKDVDATKDMLAKKYGIRKSDYGELYSYIADIPYPRVANSTRSQYTTTGLSDNREIALTVPNIEPWNRSDEIHFGDAGDGRAVAWARFGDTVLPTDEVRKAEAARADFFEQMREKYGEHGHELIISLNDSEYAELKRLLGNLSKAKNETTGRVLVIDEIQSKRHQDARESGYRNDSSVTVEYNNSTAGWDYYFDGQRQGYISEIVAPTKDDALRLARSYSLVGIPAAPFEKNWHELAMKRMLRLAAEEGYDYVAWTTGDQQGERYNLGTAIHHLDISTLDSRKQVEIYPNYRGYADTNNTFFYRINDEGIITDTDGMGSQREAVGKPAREVFGKGLSEKIMQTSRGEISGEGLRIDNEGMKGFYDDILPRFMNKYGKKWGVSVEDIELPVGEVGREIMHAVKVTPEMKESVMQGQLMFSKGLYNPRANIAPVRGGWTKDKIKKRIHGALTGHKNAARLISEFDSPQELKEHMFYHGTVHGGGALKPSILFNDRDLEFYGGGGYGERYWGISLTKDKYVATAFSGTSRGVRVYPVVLAKGANVLDGQGKYTDARDLEDDIEKLWADGVDAVWIGGGEQELCVLNPRAICNVDYPSWYEVYGLRRDKVKPLTDEEIERLYEYAKAYYETRIPQPPKVGMPKRYDFEKREWNKDYFEQYRNWENEYINSDEYKQFRKQEDEARDKIRFSKGLSDFQKSGLPSVIGPENVTDFYSSLFTLASPEIREAISRRAISNGFDFEKATGDFISELVENGIENDETGYLRAAAGILEGFIGRPVDENSLLYMLWRSANEVSESRPLTVASDISMQRRLGVGEYGNDIRFSKGIREVAEENIVQEEKAVDAAEENLKETRKAAKKSLLTVYQAMQGQKTYDKAVVDALVSYTRSILKGGEINRLSAREIGRLLGFITHSTGATARSVKKNADALLDMLIDVILKNESDALEDMLAVKGNKVNATGVEVQGRLDVRGQNVLKAIREGIHMIGEEDGMASTAGIQEALNEVENKDLFSSDDSVRKAAEDRHAGLTLARQYGDTIRTSEMEEDGLLSEKKQAATDLRDKNLTRTAYSELIADIDNALRENHIERIEAIQSLRTSVKGIIEGSVQAAADFREKEANRINEIHHLANSDMQGLSANEHVRNGESGTMDKIVNSSAVRLLTQPLATFDQMLRLFGRKSASGEGYLWNKFMRGFVDARNRQIEGTESANSELDRKVSDVFGKEMRWNDLIALESSMPKAEVTFMDGGKKKSHTLSQGNLLYIYMVNKMSDGRMKLRKMGIEQEDVDAIKAQMDPRFIEIADWVQSEFLKERRNRYNAVHERLFGSSMAAIENYFPLKINARSRYRSVDIGEEKDENAKPATTTGGIIKRVRNTTALDLLNADAFAVVKDHVEEMEQWAAFAEYNRDINTLLSYRRFRNKVEGMTTIYGAKEKLWKNFENTARIAGGVYHPSVGKFGSDSAAVSLAKGVTMAKINFRLYTAFKQILSLPAFLPDANVAYIARDIINPRAAWIWATENLPMLRERLRSRQAGDTRLMTTDKDWKIWQSKVMKMASSIGMAPNAFVDALAISIGAHAIYSTRYDRYIKDGFSEEKAERKAKQDAAVLYNESQQSNENAFLSTIQLDRTWFSTMISVFRNSSFGYQRQLHDALRNLARRMKDGYREESIASMMKQMMRDGLAEEQAQHAAERAYNREVIRSLTRVAVFGVGLEMLWNLGSHLVYLLFGDDDDKKNEMLAEDIFRGLVAGPLEGLTGGNVISELINMLHKGENLSSYDPTLMPIVSDVKRMLQMFGNDKPAAWNELINIATQAITGVNPQTFTDTVVAIVDACGGDMETSREVMVLLMRIAQVPQSQVDEIYIDELGMSAGKAKGLSYRNLAERYARYKINKKAPLTFWAYTDEAEERREKAYLKSFKKKVNERNKQ